MKTFLVLGALVACVATQRVSAPENYGPPSPYQYGYATSDEGGTSAAEEVSDGKKVQGKYSLQLSDGRTRTVTYYADETGFHADVVTNELGTESKNPADVTIKSTAPTGPEAALQFESQRIKARASYSVPLVAAAPAAYVPLNARYFKS